MDINKLATMAHGAPKPNKAQIWNVIEGMIEQAPDNDDASKAELVKLYNFFMPAVPGKPRTPENWVCKALAKNDVRYYLASVYSEGGRIIATDGHRLHVYHTSDYATGYYDSQLNSIEVDATFPNIERVLPKEPMTGTTKDVLLSGDISVHDGDQSILIDGVRFKLKYVHDALCGMPEAVNYCRPKDNPIIRIEADDKLAVVMGLRD